MLLEENNVFHAHLCKVIGNRVTNNAASNDNASSRARGRVVGRKASLPKRALHQRLQHSPLPHLSKGVSE